LSFNERRELEALPSQIDALEMELEALNAAMAAPEFYKEGADAIARTLARLDEVQHARDAAYARWDELESRERR
jgi:ATP-binding cassette subfamily F protein uup